MNGGSIFYLEALCICAAILDAITCLPKAGHLAIFTDNINTVQLFNSLTALRNFNWMLIKVVDVIIASDIDFRVFHIPGAHNVVANSLSWMQNADIFASDLEAITSTTPLSNAGGNPIMIQSKTRSRQPVRIAWTLERLLVEHSITLGFTLDHSTQSTYLSALNSYLTFCNLHHLDPYPTTDTLSFYIYHLYVTPY